MQRKGRLALAIICGVLFVVCPVFRAAESSEDGNDLPGVTNVSEIGKSTWLDTVQTEKSHLAMVAGRSQILKFGKKIKRLSVSDPEVLDFAILSANEVLLNAKTEGVVNIIAWDYEEKVSVFDISVTKDPELLLKLLKRLDPNGSFEVYPSKEVFVVKGNTSDVRLLKQIEQAANAFAEGSVSLVEIKKAKQVLLKIRFVQMTHSQDYDFGMDFQYIYKRWQFNNRMGQTGVTASGDSTYTASSTEGGSGTWANIWDTYPSTSIPTLDFNYNSYDKFFNPFLKALEEKGIAKIIARPNLLAKDGEEASFLVGGEAAVVTATNDQIGVDYKEYGTRLKFKPEIIGDEKIRLTVEPELSELDFANGVQVSGITIPSFITTRAKTVVELETGHIFVMAGLIQRRLTTTESGFPGLRRMPVIGKLFESTAKEWEEKELIVIVEPQIVESDHVSLSDAADEGDRLSFGTQMITSPIAPGTDPQLDAIEKYLLENKRFADGQSGNIPPNVPAAQPEVEVAKLSDNLDKLEAQLGMKTPKAGPQ